MMWQNVGYILDGFWCEVIHDTPDGTVEHYQGQIGCAGKQTKPWLRSNGGDKFRTPPPYALVINLRSPNPATPW